MQELLDRVVTAFKLISQLAQAYDDMAKRLIVLESRAALEDAGKTIDKARRH